MKDKKIFLVGMPASGKSTIGTLLAKQLEYDFIDLDKIIVENEGLSISDIFHSKGEDYFRQVESKYLLDLIDRKQGFILATGGGAPCFFDNMNAMNSSGITIFLNVSAKDLYRKLSKKGVNKRPLLKGISKDDLFEELQRKLEYRKKFYEQSQICLDQKLGDITDRVNQVIFAIKSLEE